MYLFTWEMTRTWKLHVTINSRAREPYAYIQDRVQPCT